jgi:putative peptide zinc metalloprotease protein
MPERAAQWEPSGMACVATGGVIVTNGSTVKLHPPTALARSVEGVERGAGRLADGVELIGEYRGSGYVETPYLIRRGDGRMIQVSALLYLVASSLDGRRDAAAVARRVSGLSGRHIDEKGVAYLLDEKLRCVGVLEAGGERGLAGPPAPLLGLTLRTGVLPARVVAAATAVLRPLFLPAVVAAALAALPAVDAWLVGHHGFATGLGEMLYQPTLLLTFLVMTVLAGCFHELGHATASRYGGAEPGVIGVGIYLIWPVFYNDLNDSYRLGRRGRIRADLGGVYFNVIFILATAGLYALTGSAFLLVVVVGQHLAILQQFLPFLRLDGYYVVSDAAGVPDLFGRIRPTLAGLLPGGRGTVGAQDLKRGARITVTAWVLVSVPLMVGALVLLAASLPRLVTAGGASAAHHARGLLLAIRAGSPVPGLVSALQLAALAVPVTGMTVTLLRGANGVAATLLRRSGGRPLAETTARLRLLLGVAIGFNMVIAVGGLVRVHRDGRPPVAVAELLTAETGGAGSALSPTPGTDVRDGARALQTSTTVSGVLPNASAAPTTRPPTRPPTDVLPSTTVPPGPATVEAVVVPRAHPSSAEIEGVLEQLRRRMPLFQPTSAQVMQFGDQVCTALDQHASVAQVNAGVVSAASRVPLLTVSPADAAAAIRAAVTLFCPGHLPEIQ